MKRKLQVIRSFGVTTGKYSTGIVQDAKNLIIDIPIGCCVARFDMKTEERILLKQVSQSIVAYMKMRNGVIMITSTCGDISFWDSKNEYSNCFWSFQIPTFTKVYHVEWSSIEDSSHLSQVLICCDFEKEHQGIVLGFIINLEEKEVIRQNYEIKGDFEFCSMTPNNDVFLIQQDDENPKLGSNCLIMAKETQNNKVKLGNDEIVTTFASSEDHKYSSFCTSGRVLTIIEFSTSDYNPKETMINVKYKKKLVSLDVGRITCLKFVDHVLYVANTGGKLLEFDMNNQEIMMQGEEEGEVETQNCQTYDIKPKETVFYFDVISYYPEEEEEQNQKKLKRKKQKNVIIMSNESTFSVYNFQEQVVIGRVNYLGIAGCGITLNKQQQIIANGDLAGNVTLWNNNNNNNKQTQQNSPSSPPYNINLKKNMIGQVNVGISIRCLAFRPHTNHLQLGTFDGTCYDWDFSEAMEIYKTDSGNIKKDPKGTINRLFSVTHCINCMEWYEDVSNPDPPKVFACGTSGGFLVLLEAHPGEDYMRIRFSSMIHKPRQQRKVQDERFGSMHKFSEIWSICFSPDGNFIATASEDQTVRIVSSETGEEVHVLCGHEIAVTSIQWFDLDFDFEQQQQKKRNEFLISCGDDCRIIVWKNNSIDCEEEKTKWYLFKTFSTKNEGIYWHTLTYIDILPVFNIQEEQEQEQEYYGRSMNINIIVVTQNGYCFVFEMFQQQEEKGNNNGCLFKNKIHIGSIEGLCVDIQNQNFATISADCCLNVYKLL